MIPWKQLDIAQIPNGGGDIRLIQRGAEFSIMLGPIVLMNSRLKGSEEALASMACERMAGRTQLQMLIGGLGMGFTLRAALAVLADDARVTVAELVPAVVKWARGPMAEIFGESLGDPRVKIHDGDIAPLIRASKSAWDAILLDVDNGPDGLTHAGNDRLYSAAGLASSIAALRPGGVLLIWSQGPDEKFAARMRRSGLAVEEVRVRANRKGRGERHVIWIGTKAR